jgi:hypothetical protein
MQNHTKPTYWVSMARWMGLTIEEHRKLDAYCARRGLELGIDIKGYHTGDRRQQAEFQRDRDESQETAGGPGT